MNSLSAIGRVGRDAVTRRTQAGTAVTGWSMAVDVGFGDNKQTLWLDCSWWSERAAKVAEYLVKGSQLGVVGEVGTREHDGKTYVTLNVRDVTLIGGKKATEDAPKVAKSSQRSTGGPVSDPGDDIPFANIISRRHWSHA